MLNSSTRRIALPVSKKKNVNKEWIRLDKRLVYCFFIGKNLDERWAINLQFNR